jgi:hypothetical protein
MPEQGSNAVQELSNPQTMSTGRKPRDSLGVFREKMS